MSDVAVLQVSAFRQFEDALNSYIQSTGAAVKSAAIAAAGPEVDGAIRMTNASWHVSRKGAEVVLPGAAITVVNDLAAVARALPSLTATDTDVLHAGQPRGAPAPLLAVNVGTGFGAAVVLPHANDWIVLATEAGHMSLCRSDEAGLPDARVTEDVLSGPGLQRLRAERGTDKARKVFARLLGKTVGDLVLATGSWGGVYLCGGVLTAGGGALDTAQFLETLQDRHGVASRLRSVPVRVITHPYPAFLGLSLM